MRVATFLTAAAIAALTTVGPALAYGPATSSPSLSYLSGGSETASSVVAKKQTMVAFAIVKETGIGYVMVKSDNGRAQQYKNCDKRELHLRRDPGVLEQQSRRVIHIFQLSRRRWLRQSRQETLIRLRVSD